MEVFNLLKIQLKLLFKNKNYVLQLVFLPLILLTLIGYVSKDVFNGTITAYEYYFCGILIFIYSGMGTNVSFNFINKDNKSANLRIIFAPVNSIWIYTSHVISSLIFAAFSILINMISFKIFFKVDYYNSALIIYVTLLSVVLLSSSIGILISIIIDNSVIVEEFFTIFQILFCFLGGCFFSVESLGGILAKISYVSPMKYLMDGLMKSMYESNNLILYIIILVNFILSFLVIKGGDRAFKEESYI